MRVIGLDVHRSFAVAAVSDRPTDDADQEPDPWRAPYKLDPTLRRRAVQPVWPTLAVNRHRIGTPYRRPIGALPHFWCRH
jgi:hypothetical protein